MKKERQTKFKKKLSQYLPKYFKSKAKEVDEECTPVMIVPSLTNPKTLEGNISLSLPVKQQLHFKQLQRLKKVVDMWLTLMLRIR
ncbi:hypothetical protein IAE51_05300 [Lactococcus sp. S64]|uniref:hypothetical protein n=1 Tax=Lactococcus sp. S64 TaxID=2767459 RepID=UPI001908E3C8|nr:hypothetical protein [Lactococcus sp. S64]MBK0083320.1 hypothetical protein [Lactococcus sp. S64]